MSCDQSCDLCPVSCDQSCELCCHPVQLWSLLPGFCRQPTDISVSFPSLARILGTALSDREDLRTVVASALRQLVEGSREEGEEEGEGGFWVAGNE